MPDPKKTNPSEYKRFIQHKITGDMSQTINNFIGNHPDKSLNKRTLFSLWSGGNDYIRWVEDMPNRQQLLAELREGTNEYFDIVTSGVVFAFSKSLKALYEAGGRNFMIMPVPDLSLTPLCRRNGAEVTQICGKLVALHSEKLTKFYTAFEQHYTDVKIMVPNVNDMIAEIILAREKYQVEQNVEPCYDGFYGFEAFRGKEVTTCGDRSDGLMFYDEVHPNYRVHCYLAGFFLKKMHSSWPHLEVASPFASSDKMLDFDQQVLPYCLDPTRSRI
jgi:phospholipase/lecithinase/hemolysin